MDSTPDFGNRSPDVAAQELPTAAAGTTVTMLPVRDAASRMFLLKCLVAAFDEADHGLLAQLVSDGFTPELIDRLRGMTM